MPRVASPPPALTGEAGRAARIYYVISGLYTLSASLIWGVNTLFLLDAGLNIFETFVANSVFTAAMVAFEIPTGVLADTKGRRISFLLSLVVLLASTLGYVALAESGGGVLAFSLVSVVMGIGFTLYSGAVEAWVVDALRAVGYDGSLDGLFAKGAIVTGGAMLLGTVGGGFLGTVDLSLPYLVRSGLLVATFVVALAAMHDVGFTPRPVTLGHLGAEMRKVGRAGVTWGWQEPRLRLLVFASFIQMGFLMWGWYAWQPYFLELLGSEAVWVAGTIAAAAALATMLGNGMVEFLGRYCARRSTLLILASLVSSAAIVMVGLAGSFWVAVASFLVSMVAFGVLQPVKQALLHKLVPSEHRATVVSFDSMFGNAGGIVGQTGLGALGQRTSIADGYVVGGVLTLIAVPIFARLRKVGMAYDLGCEPSPEPQTTAAQGLPEICTVDTVVSVPAAVGAGSEGSETGT
ncbi:MAG: MFS transporter [Actinomycetota bacterium]